MEDADTRPAHGESGSQGVVGGIAFSGEQFSGLGIEESLQIFSMLYAGSRSGSALLRPILGDDGSLADAEILATNDEWQATRARPVRSGSLASGAYSGWENLKPILQQAHAHGSATQVWNSGAGDSRVVGGLMKEVEWRRLPNALIIETARDQSLMAVVAEAAGPVLVVDLEDGKLPSRIIQMNQAFADMFMSGFSGIAPTFGNMQPQRDLALTDVRDHVHRIFPDEDWGSFDRRTTEIYSDGTDVYGDPFYLNGNAFLRDYYVRPIGSKEYAGIWVYRPAGPIAVNQLPEFAHTRSMAVQAAVENLSRPIAAHEVIVDEEGQLSDISLLWANRAWQSYRSSDLPQGTLGSESRVRFAEDLLPFLKRAWTLGESTQFFRFNPDDADTGTYRDDYVRESALEIETIFSRTDDGFLMEWGDDVDLKVQLGSDMEAQRRAALEIAFEAQERSIRKGEHDRIVRELHDNILQELFVASMTLSREEAVIGESESSRLASVRNALGKISTDIRAIISDSKERDGDPLLETLRDLCDGWDGVQGFTVELEEFSVVDETVLDRLPSIVVDNVVSVTREALSNAVKHSGGSKIKVDILVLKDHLQFSIVDNGNGVDPRNSRSSGTLNMKARMASLGGHLEMHSTSSGVRVEGAAPFSIEII